MVEAIVKFDGGARPNPGPSAIGYVVEAEEWTTSGNDHIGDSTNNKAEYHALIAGLEAALDNDVMTVTAKGDSELIVKQVQGEYSVNEESLRPLYDRIQELISEFEQFDIEHVPRDQNKEADRLVEEVLSD